MVMIESEGITEQVAAWRSDIPGRFVEALGLEQVMFEAADPDVFAWYVRNYGPEVNLFVDQPDRPAGDPPVRHLGHQEPLRTGPHLQGLTLIRRDPGLPASRDRAARPPAAERPARDMPSGRPGSVGLMNRQRGLTERCRRVPPPVDAGHSPPADPALPSATAHPATDRRAACAAYRGPGSSSRSRRPLSPLEVSVHECRP